MADLSIPNMTKKIISSLKNITGGEQSRQSFLVAIPYSWLIVFFLVPFLIIVKISLSETGLKIPPVESIFHWLEGSKLAIKLNYSTYKALFKDPFYIESFTSSVITASIATIFSLVIGFSMAYGMARADPKHRNILLLLFMLPFLTSFLIRVYAWMSLLSNTGYINTFLMAIGLIKQPIGFLNTRFSVCLGLIYCYLPFMILPIYASLEKMDPSYLEAAHDLGAGPITTFFRITVPLAFPGVLAGCVLVFVPTVGEFVIPELLGGPDTLMVGRALWGEFFYNRDWPLACAMAVSMLFIFVVPIMIFQRWQNENNVKDAKKRGGFQ